MKNNAQGGRRPQRKQEAAGKPAQREVAPHCVMCELVALGIHGLLTKRMGLTARAWENRLHDLCGDQLGCEVFLSRKNTAVLSRTLQELSSVEGGRLPQVHELQATFCFDITGACPSGHRGEKRHAFLAVARPDPTVVAVKVRLWSKLIVGKVHVYWLNPAERSTRDVALSGTLVPGGSLMQYSFSGHSFRLLGPGVQWTDKAARLDAVLSDSPEQHYEVSLNGSWVPDLPAFVADPDAEALLPDDSTEVWMPLLVLNPDTVHNRRYVLLEVFPRGFRSDL